MKRVRAIRRRLGFTQSTMAELLGVHAMTVSRWERGLLPVPPYQAALITAFDQAVRNARAIGPSAERLLRTEGVARALYILLRTAYR